MTTSILGGVLDPAGPNARGAEDLWWLMLVIGTVVFAVVLVLLVLGLRRTGSGDDRDEADGSTWVIGGGVILPAVVIAVVLAATVFAMRDTADADDVADGTVVIDVIGHQWWWEIRYPDHDVTTANEIHIPAGEPVLLRLRSADVIHSFWVPDLAGKLDLLPERTNELVIEADQPGRYDGRCAEFCGLQHANMDVFVVALGRDGFDRWIDEQAADAMAPSEPAAMRGAGVFADAGCARCHTVSGTGADGTRGPDLTHLASRRTIAAGTLPLTTGDLRSWVHDPGDAKTGVSMPPADLPDDQLDELVAYLDGLE